MCIIHIVPPSVSLMEIPDAVTASADQLMFSTEPQNTSEDCSHQSNCKYFLSAVALILLFVCFFFSKMFKLCVIFFSLIA